ncbi:GspH/FimT family pseudopilin [Sedimenticola selenatireducens]|nr:GspH/FimT family pseudopilin [Sedimenticola selenatireducens]
MKRNHIQGFSLIELMITLVVAAIVLTLAVPSLSDVVTRNRVTAEINSLIATLNEGRSEAIKRGRTVSLCGDTACGGTWSNGWILFEDTDNDGTLDAGETPIKISNGFTSGSDTLTYTATNTYVQFKSDGFALQTGTFKLCESGGAAKYARAAYISPTGRVRLSSDSNGNGIHDDGQTTPNELSCP